MAVAVDGTVVVVVGGNLHRRDIRESGERRESQTDFPRRGADDRPTTTTESCEPEKLPGSVRFLPLMVSDRFVPRGELFRADFRLAFPECVRREGRGNLAYVWVRLFQLTRFLLHPRRV